MVVSVFGADIPCDSSQAYTFLFLFPCLACLPEVSATQVPFAHTSGAASYNECRCRPHAYILYGVVAVRVRCTSSLAALLGSKYLGWQPSVKRAQVAKYASSISHN